MRMLLLLEDGLCKKTGQRDVACQFQSRNSQEECSGIVVIVDKNLLIGNRSVFVSSDELQHGIPFPCDIRRTFIVPRQSASISSNGRLASY